MEFLVAQSTDGLPVPTSTNVAFITVTLGLLGLLVWGFKFILSDYLPAQQKAFQAAIETFAKSAIDTAAAFRDSVSQISQANTLAVTNLITSRDTSMDKMREAFSDLMRHERENCDKRNEELVEEVRNTRTEHSALLRDIGNEIHDLGETMLSRTRQADIVRSAADAIYTKGLDGKIRDWNDAAEKLFGWKSPEIIGQLVYRLVPPELRGEEEDLLRIVGGGEAVDHFVTHRLTKDGRRVRVSMTVSPVKDLAGKVNALSSVVREI